MHLRIAKTCAAHAQASLFEIQCLFGTTNRRHCRVQTGEDNMAMETQTETPATKAAGMQAPDDLGLAPGRNLDSHLISEKEQKAQSKSAAAKLLVEYDR
eukprot:SAG31_NODE_2886_length_4952_cov_4.399135_3_plen_99_part_00